MTAATAPTAPARPAAPLTDDLDLEAFFNASCTPDGLVPLRLMRHYIDLMRNCKDTGAVTNVLLAYRPGEVAACGVAVVRKVAR